MDNSLKTLEENLEKLVPRGLSDEGRVQCERTINELSEKVEVSAELVDFPASQSSWKTSAAAAAVILAVGVTSGWMLGKDAGQSTVTEAAPEPSRYLGDILSSAPGEDEHVIIVQGQRTAELRNQAGQDEVHFKDSDGKVIKLRFSK